MDTLLKIVQTINMYLSDYVLIILLLGAGLYFTIRTKFVQVRYEADFVAVLNGALHTDLPLFMYETGERETIRDAIEHTAQPIASAAIITGPEGGFAEFEADMARKLGMHICSMGERILRCETAPVVALTALMYGTGNL